MTKKERESLFMKMKNLIHEKEKTEESLYKKIKKGNKFRQLYKKRMLL